MRKTLWLIGLILALASCEKRYIVTVTVHGNGSVNPMQVADVPTGESRSLTITPESGNSLHTIKANGLFDQSVTLTNTATTYLLPNITSDIALDVTFVSSPYVKLIVKPSDTILPYGDTCTVIWETANVNPVYLNHVQVKTPISGDAYRLFADTKFTLTGKFGDYTFTDEKEVKVGDWTTSTFGLVSYYPWKYKAQRITRDGVILYILQLDEEELSWVIYYHKDGTVSYSHTTQVVSWVVPNDDTIIINGTTLKLQIGQEEMILSYQTMYNGELIWFDMVFEHASDIPTDS